MTYFDFRFEYLEASPQDFPDLQASSCSSPSENGHQAPQLPRRAMALSDLSAMKQLRMQHSQAASSGLA